MIWQFGEMGYDYSINHCENGTIDESVELHLNLFDGII